MVPRDMRETNDHITIMCNIGYTDTPSTDKIDESIGLHLAKNEMKYIYMESPMEGLVQTFKTMKAEHQTYCNVKLIPLSKGTSAKQRELLKQDYVWDILECFDSAGIQYWHSRAIMNFNDFYSTMLLSYGGVSGNSLCFISC